MSGEFLRVVAALQQQMNATFWRSDALRPLHIMLGSLILLVLGLAYAGVPAPIMYGACVLVGLAALTELSAFVYCLLKDPDLLRSERYRLQKMALEAHLLGDETSGLFEVTAEELNAQPQLPATMLQIESPTPIKSPRSRKKQPQL